MSIWIIPFANASSSQNTQLSKHDFRRAGACLDLLPWGFKYWWTKVHFRIGRSCLLKSSDNCLISSHLNMCKWYYPQVLTWIEIRLSVMSWVRVPSCYSEIWHRLADDVCLHSEHLDCVVFEKCWLTFLLIQDCQGAWPVCKVQNKQGQLFEKSNYYEVYTTFLVMYCSIVFCSYPPGYIRWIQVLCMSWDCAYRTAFQFWTNSETIDAFKVLRCDAFL